MAPSDPPTPSSSSTKTPTPIAMPQDHSHQQPDYFKAFSPAASTPHVAIPGSLGERRVERRSSFTQGLDTIVHAGGPNSIANYARSWSRATGFFEITPQRSSYISVSTHDDDDPEAPILDDDSNYPDEEAPLSRTISVGSYGNYGTLAPAGMPGTGRFADSPGRRGGEGLFDDVKVDMEREPMLVKTVTLEDGKQALEIVGQSTMYQTIFNCINILMGIGMLSLPLAFVYSGWVFGIIILLFATLSTNYTAKLLAKCLDKAPPGQAMVTYSDIAYIAFGPKSRMAVSILFSFELLAACVALVVLFADSLNMLFPEISLLAWKLLAILILTPLSFCPLRFLSISSLLGVISTFSIFFILVIDGVIKPDSPGSLRTAMPTHLFPENWWTLPLSMGLIMAPYGGHSVFPNVYTDMRHPQKYNRAVNVTYAFASLLNLCMAIVGLIMFGDDLRQEITSNILELSGYPQALNILLVLSIAVIPISKTPLNARPIISTLEILLGVDSRSIASEHLPVGGSTGLVGMAPLTRTALKIAITVGVNVLFVAMSIAVPDFDKLMSFMGSTLCFTICLVLPLAFYLKIYTAEIAKSERVTCWVLMVVGAVLAIVGTAVTFTPKSALGLESV